FIRQLQRGLGGALGGGRGGRSGGGLGPMLLVLAVAIVIWVGLPNSGWFMVAPNQQGVILRFGDYHRSAGPGFHLKLPIPFERVLKPAVTQLNEIQIGGIADVPRGRGASAETDSLMLTGDENIVDLEFTVQWVINTEATADYLFNIDNPDTVVRAVTESAMREVIGQTALQPIITEDIGGVARRVRDIVQATLNEYEAGVTITDVLVQRPTLPQAENPNDRGDVTRDPLAAYLDVENAQQENQKTIQDARAYANRVIPEARGDAQRIREAAAGYRDSVVAEAAGDAERFRLIYEQYRLAPQVTRQRMFLETMEKVLGASNKVILDEENGSGSGLVPYLPLNEFTRNQGASR
ncbi:MAG: FtsH protease activity modulator HflK, partial [Caulobacterales bacterium]|nr:FtsH protease activity modulator HflK [Caulobacterales bacterium]